MMQPLRVMWLTGGEGEFTPPAAVGTYDCEYKDKMLRAANQFHHDFSLRCCPVESEMWP